MLSMLTIAVISLSWIVFLAIMTRVVISWISISRKNPVYKIAFAISEPLLSPVRRILIKSPLGGQGMSLDFSPAIVVYLAFKLSEIAQIIIMSFA